MYNKKGKDDIISIIKFDDARVPILNDFPGGRSISIKFKLRSIYIYREKLSLNKYYFKRFRITWDFAEN